MNKLKYIIAGLISIVLLSSGLIVAANGNFSSNSTTGTTSEFKEETSGRFVSLDEGKGEIKLITASGTKTIRLAKSVWVFRDEKKAGLKSLKREDKLELIMNTLQQAAYIKAYSKEYAESVRLVALMTPTPTPEPTREAALEVTQSASPVATQVVTPEVAPITTPVPTEVVIAKSTLTKNPKEHAVQSVESKKKVVASSNNAWEKLYIKVQGEELKLSFLQDFSGSNSKYNVSIETNSHGQVNLNGEQARQLMNIMLANIDLRSPDSKKRLLINIAKQLGVSSNGFTIEMDIKWNEEKNVEHEKNVEQTKRDKHDDRGKNNDSDKFRHRR